MFTYLFKLVARVICMVVGGTGGGGGGARGEPLVRLGFSKLDGERQDHLRLVPKSLGSNW